MSTENEPNLEGHRLQTEYYTWLRSLASALRPYPFLREGEEGLTHVADNGIEPFSLAVFGRMKTGKSTLINALTGRRLAITGVEEATATINRLTYADGALLNSFTVHWKDDRPQSFPLDDLQRDWSGTGKDVLERVSRCSWLELYSDTPILKDIHIIDTPGTGSTAQEHEDAARQFISGQETDALVYVFSPVGRETDEEALLAFRKGCLPGSSPYNSVAVLHKWDHIYWNNGGNWDDIKGKANRLHEAMKSMVATVIPVSGPLALAVKCAPENFWDKCLELLNHFDTEDSLTRELSRDTKWDRTPRQQELRQEASLHGLPWSSFQILIRHLYRERPESSACAKLLIWALSGMDELEKLLDRSFFKQAAVIRQRQTRAKVQKILRSIYDKIDSTLKEQQDDLRIIERLEQAVESAPELAAWLSRKEYALRGNHDKLITWWKEIDKKVIQASQEHDINDHALEIIRWLDSTPGLFSQEQTPFLRTILSSPLSAHSTEETQILVLLRRTAELCFEPNKKTRQYAEWLRDYLIQVLEKSTNNTPSTP